MSKGNLETNKTRNKDYAYSIILPAETYQSSSKHLGIQEYSNTLKEGSQSITKPNLKVNLKSTCNTRPISLIQGTAFSIQKSYSSKVINLRQLASPSDIRREGETPKNSRFYLSKDINDETYSLSDVSSLDLNNSLEYVSEVDINEEVFEF